MKLLDLTLDTPQHNVALDEALLESAEANPESPEVLRLWEPNRNFVVIGRSSPIESEVNLPFCQQNKFDVIRRASGGAAVVAGPGCLMYCVLLDYRKRPELRMLEQAHQFVMGKMQKALSSLGIETQFRGTCDLTIDDCKVSGNALRCKRNWLIYHGTMLCTMPLNLVTDCLGTPKRQPNYRQGRPHSDFVSSIPTETTTLSASIAKQWECVDTLNEWPAELTDRLVKEKYLQQDWNFKIR